ncbi:hypothetical protein LSTR_LSTR003755 [Laodelphax striatellus]|uniref:Uncharacterized protein n=1 Tax=Laodelphax striatellus TaxID=195883 RepID=A0A482WNY2_LAOST|nr:hypothetical protein LSTR_LSTR003755 [Laodelphax striatellus]
MESACNVGLISGEGGGGGSPRAKHGVPLMTPRCAIAGVMTPCCLARCAAGHPLPPLAKEPSLVLRLHFSSTETLMPALLNYELILLRSRALAPQLTFLVVVRIKKKTKETRMPPPPQTL